MELAPKAWARTRVRGSGSKSVELGPKTVGLDLQLGLGPEEVELGSRAWARAEVLGLRSVGQDQSQRYQDRSQWNWSLWAWIEDHGTRFKVCEIQVRRLRTSTEVCGTSTQSVDLVPKTVDSGPGLVKLGSRIRVWKNVHGLGLKSMCQDTSPWSQDLREGTRNTT